MSDKIKSIIAGVTFGIITTVAFIVSSFVVKEEGDKKVIFMALETFKYMGAFFMILGVSQTMIAYRSDDIDGKIKALVRLLVGVWLSLVYAVVMLLS